MQSTGVSVYLLLSLYGVQDAGENSVANIDRLLHADGKITPAVLRLKMQKVVCCFIISVIYRLILLLYRNQKVYR